MKPWKFYGRTRQLAVLAEMLGRRRWFFAKVSGRRRIGKTALIQRALQAAGASQPVFYVQIPDSEPAGVLSAVNDALDTFRVPVDRFPRPHDVGQLAKLIEAMATDGYVLVLDEFQYFNRKGYAEFCSLLQAAVDRLAAKSAKVPGGLIVLGSIYTEMAALLEDRVAPLYNRVTDDIEPHPPRRRLTPGYACATTPIWRLADCCSSGPSLKACRNFYRDCFMSKACWRPIGKPCCAACSLKAHRPCAARPRIGSCASCTAAMTWS